MEPSLANPNASSEGIALSPSSWSFRIVRIALGLFLLTAAVLKFQDYSLDSVGRSAFLSSARLYVAVLVAEAGLGLWLLTGRAARALWLTAFLFFLGLAFVSLHLALTGHPSCGCFGKWMVSPWYSFGLDLLAVAALTLSGKQMYWGGGAGFAFGVSPAIAARGSWRRGYLGRHSWRPNRNVWFALCGLGKSARRVRHGRSSRKRSGRRAERRNTRPYRSPHESQNASHPHYRRQQRLLLHRHGWAASAA